MSQAKGSIENKLDSVAALSWHQPACQFFLTNTASTEGDQDPENNLMMITIGPLLIKIDKGLR